jgi:hypothetical protein
MPNTSQENGLARQAAQLLMLKYREYLTDALLQKIGSAGDFEIQNYVKFYDDQAFRMNLITFDPTPPQGCRVSAFTDRQGKPLIINDTEGKALISGSSAHSVVYINRSCATAGTLVHELLHAVSHMNWYLWAMMQSPNPNEAVTEWLTRRALKGATMQAFQNIDRSSAYQQDFQTFKTAKGQMKEDVADIGDQIRAAYFRGITNGNLSTVISMFSSASKMASTDYGAATAAAFGGAGGRAGRGRKNF